MQGKKSVDFGELMKACCASCENMIINQVAIAVNKKWAFELWFMLTEKDITFDDLARIKHSRAEQEKFRKGRSEFERNLQECRELYKKVIEEFRENSGN